jgi:diguanylate cyclase (GGDEF)-like protein
MFGLFETNTIRHGDSDYLMKSALGVSVVSFLILLPFGINNFIQGRTLGAIVTICVSLLFAYNAYIAWRGHYSLSLNLFGVVPSFTLGAANALIELSVAGSYWSYLCVFAIYFILPFRYTIYANAVFLAAVISAAWVSLELTIFIRFSVVLIGASTFIFISRRENTKAYDLIEKQAITDSLTGLLNRSTMPPSLEAAILRSKKNGKKSTLCLIDIDHFKTINDMYGHEVGDRVLVGLSESILKLSSRKDTLFRIGGEEFLILMNNTDLNEGSKTADALRSVVEDLSLVDNHQVTISIGVSEVSDDYDWKQWMKRSDENLYKAKENGRNQVAY